MESAVNRHTKPDDIKLDDDAAERVRRSHAQAISNLQTMPSASMVVIPNVSLADTVATPVAHTLGRAPTFVRESTPRGAVSAGRIDEIRDNSVDRTRFVLLKATGFGATITVDIQVL